MLKSAISVLFLLLALATAASAKGTGYVFVSHEKTNNIAVIDPKQDYRIIKWIDTSQPPATCTSVTTENSCSSLVAMTT